MKDKMKRVLYIIFSLALSGLLLLMTITGCSNAKDAADKVSEESDSSFIMLEQKILEGGYYYRIVYHKETKVMYVLGQYNDFTVMLDIEGKPLLWEEE